MTTINVIEQQISSIREYLKILKDCRKYSRSQIENENIVRGAIERFLYLLSQEVIHTAEAIISFKKFRRPDTYAEAFRILNEENFISLDLSLRLIEVAKFRNIIAHDYKKINYDTVYDILHNGLKDVEAFLKEINKSLDL